MAAFGGHRGGGKKREDGLVAGSLEAKAADKKKDADRKVAERAAKKLAALPPALPGVAAPVSNASAPAAGGVAALAAAALGQLVAPGVAAPAPLFVGWSEKILARPLKLLTKICDRVRCAGLMARVRQLGLSKEQEKEIESDLKYKQVIVDDFNAALTTCAAVEMNKRRCPGAEHSHWLDVTMTGGELVLIHMNTVEKLEKMIAENKQAKSAKAESAKAGN